MNAAAGVQQARTFTATSPDGLRISAQEWGNPNGIEIVFIHGFCQSHLSWRRQTSDPALARRYRMVTFDMRGHGATGGPADKAHYYDDQLWGDDVAAVIATAGMKRPYLVAWSQGGRIVADYLRTHGKSGLAGINYVDAACSADQSLYGAGHLVRPMLSDDMAECIPATRQFLRACFAIQPAPEDFETMLAFNMMVPAATRRLILDRPRSTPDAMAALTVPVLVTHGREDRVVLEPMAHFIASTVKGARLSLYDGIGHSPFWEDPARFNTELAAFAL